MFVGMWMTREVLTVDPAATLAHIAAHDGAPQDPPSAGGERHARRRRSCSASSRTRTCCTPFRRTSIRSRSIAADSIVALESSGRQARVYAADLMARDPLVTAPDAPIESAARLMRDRKIGALPVVTDGILVGLITESDIFRAMVEVFEARERAVRITFSLKPGEDMLPLVAEIARRRSMRVTSFMALSHHEPPLCVVQLAGAKLEEALDDVWKSQHRVMNVVQLTPEETGSPAT